MDHRTHKIITLMQDDLRRDLPLARIAQAVNLSSSRLRHLFKNETGATPTKYLHALRMREARRLLETTSLRVKEVRSAVGLGDDSHFVRDFKSAHGQSPAEYRSCFMTYIAGDGVRPEQGSHFRQLIATFANRI